MSWWSLCQVPPQKGGQTVVAHRKLRKPAKNFHTAIANVVQGP